jgi:hypothetical protein
VVACTGGTVMTLTTFSAYGLLYLFVLGTSIGALVGTVIACPKYGSENLLEGGTTGFRATGVVVEVHGLTGVSG